MRQPALASSEPRGSSVLRKGDFSRALERGSLWRLPFKSAAKNSCEIFAEAIRQIAALDAALVQQAGPRPAMGSARDFAIAAQDVGADCVGKAIVGYLWGRLIGQDRGDVVWFQSAANCLVHCRV